MEDQIESIGGNPPFCATFITSMIGRLESNARKNKPYCRCLLFPLAPMYGVERHTQGVSSQGILVARIPAGCLSFKSQERFLNTYVSPRQHAFQTLGIVVWRNCEHFPKYPPPADVEMLYMHWIAHACLHPSTAKFLLPTLEGLYLFCMRSNQAAADSLY